MAGEGFRGGITTPSAYALLTTIYLEGKGVPQNVPGAAEVIFKLFDIDDPKSIAPQLLTTMLDNYSHLGKDNSWVNKANYYIENRLKPGDRYAIGISYYAGIEMKEVNYEKALFWFTDAVKHNEPGAYFFIGSMYTLGQGVSVDVDKAIYWHEKGVESGATQSKLILAKLYQSKNTDQKKKQAFQLIKSEADANNTFSYRMLANCYKEGRGVERSKEKALKYYILAAENGDDVSQNNVGYAYFSGEGQPKDYKKAFKWLSASANQGQGNAALTLSVQYLKGLGVEKNIKKAFYWSYVAFRTLDDKNMKKAARQRMIRTGKFIGKAEGQITVKEAKRFLTTLQKSQFKGPG
ncbi:MAG: tetratricopeptide repeat protein [Porticoccaceae bacterium]